MLGMILGALVLSAGYVVFVRATKKSIIIAQSMDRWPMSLTISVIGEAAGIVTIVVGVGLLLRQ